MTDTTPDVSLPDANQLTIKRIQEYVWERYVEFQSAPFDLDEEEALAFLKGHYEQHPLAEDSECFYYGILAYERAFSEDPPTPSLMQTALEAFQAYRNQTSSGFTWDAVEDRYADALAVAS